MSHLGFSDADIATSSCQSWLDLKADGRPVMQDLW
jgi:hypothetical protein